MDRADITYLAELLKADYDSLDESSKKGDIGSRIRKIRDGLIGVHEDFPLYSDVRFERIIEKGEYRGHKYLIRSLGSHPCAYVTVNVTNCDFDDLDGGLDVNYKSWEWSRFQGMEGSESWIGWDYGHAGDYNPEFCEDGRKYTTDDLRADCRKTIDELIRRFESKTE